MFDAASGEELAPCPFELVGGPAHDDDLEAVVVVEVNVESGVHFVAERVLEVGEALGQVADVVVVDERERSDRVATGANFGASNFGANEVTKKLGSRPASFLDELVEILEERPFHGDAESNELVLHDLVAILAEIRGEMAMGNRCLAGTFDGGFGGLRSGRQIEA